MKIDFCCYNCIFKLVLELSEQLGATPEHRLKLVNEFLTRLVEVAELGGSPPELLAHFWGEIMVRETGKDDPFAEIKHRSTQLGLQLLPDLRRRAEESGDYFATALRLAVAGNIIDYGVDRQFDLATAEEKILSVLDAPFDRAAAADLKARLDAAESVLYILDNCGEAVVDRLVMEPYAAKLTVAVRGRPVLNDVTRADAAESGITFAPIIDTGDATAGVSLRRSDPEFLRRLRQFDLVIAKGQGNFESLEHLFDRPIYYLLRAKCAVITKLLDCELNSIQIIGRNLS